MPSTDPQKPVLVLARQLYDGVGHELQSDQLIEIEGERIIQIRPATAQDARDPKIRDFDLVAPGLIDLQINGAGDTQFNSEPNAQALDELRRARERAARPTSFQHLSPQQGRITDVR